MPVFGSLRHEQLADTGVELGELSVLRVDLRREVLAHLGVFLTGEQLARVGEVGVGVAVLAVRLDDRLELGVPTTGVARGTLVTGGVDLRQL